MLRAFSRGTLFGSQFGTAQPWVLALHGWQRTNEDFNATLKARDDTGGAADLHDAEIDAIAIDLPGFGSAPEPDGAWGTLRYAQFIAPILDEMADQVVVLGHSFGGIVALQLAQVAPERVRALVLTGAPLFRPTGSSAHVARPYRAIRALSRTGLVSQRRLEAARMKYGSSDYRNANPKMRAVLVQRLSEDYEDLLGAVNAPVELVWGERDTASPPSDAERAAGILARPHVVVLAGVDHFTPIHAPLSLREALLRQRP